MSMLAGLGRGLQNFSTILGDHEKMNRAEQQRQLDHERQVHLADLTHRRQAALQKDSQDFLGKHKDADRLAQSQEAAIARAAAAKQAEVNFGRDKEGWDIKHRYDIASSDHDAKNRLKSLTDTLALEEEQNGKMTEKSLAALRELGLPEKQTKAYEALVRGGLGVEASLAMAMGTENGGIDWKASDVNDAIKQGNELWNALGTDAQEAVGLEISEKFGEGSQLSLRTVQEYFVANHVDNAMAIGGGKKGGGNRFMDSVGKGSEGKYDKATDLPQFLAMPQDVLKETLARMPVAEREKALSDLRGKREMPTERTEGTPSALTGVTAAPPVRTSGRPGTQAEAMAAQQEVTEKKQLEEAKLEESIEAKALEVAISKGYKSKSQVKKGLWKTFRNTAMYDMGLKKGL